MLSCILEFINENLISLLAISISLGALFNSHVHSKKILLNSNRMLHDHRISLRPILGFTYCPVYVPETHLGLKVKNNGLGPAIISDYNITLDGINFIGLLHLKEMLLMATVNAKRLGYDPKGIKINFLTREVVIGVNEEIKLFEVFEITQNPEDLIYYQRFLNLLQIRIKFKSMYGEKYEKPWPNYSLENTQQLFSTWINGSGIEPRSKADI